MDPANLRRLVQAGMDVARLNFSHGGHDQHAHVIKSLREISLEVGRPITLLQDLSGPKVRVGEMIPEGALLEKGTEFVLTSEPCIGDAKQASRFLKLWKMSPPERISCSTMD
jgi:pyruvate kinase